MPLKRGLGMAGMPARHAAAHKRRTSEAQAGAPGGAQAGRRQGRQRGTSAAPAVTRPPPGVSSLSYRQFSPGPNRRRAGRA